MSTGFVMPSPLPSPMEIGLPEKFAHWRENQPEAIEAGLVSKFRFVGQVAPTGFGKSAAYITQAILHGGRVAILTSTKGLQDQLLHDFGGIGLVDIRGKSNYQCACDPELTCEEGYSGKCTAKGSVLCPWSQAMFRAKSARMVTSNYSCWIAQNKYGQGLGNFDLLVLDEAHNAPEELSRAMQVLISHRETEEILKRSWPKSGRESMLVWKDWARASKVTCDILAKDTKAEIDSSRKPKLSMLKLFSHLKNLSRKLDDIATCNPEHWVVDEWEHGYQFDPINPSRYGERVLFRGIEKVILTSATIRPKTLEMIGVPFDQFDFMEYPSSFLPTRSPIIHIPTVKVDHRLDDGGLQRLVTRMDEILSSRMDRKAIIHTISFRMRNAILDNSCLEPFMLSNKMRKDDPETTSMIVKQFKDSEAPSILVTPSVTTGYDFPGSQCRIQIITKVPFPDQRSKVAKARAELDKDLGLYQAMMQLVQMCGRAMRSQDDWQEVFLLDNHCQWFIWKAMQFAPSWFRAFYRVSQRVPPPLQVAEAHGARRTR